MLPIVPRGRRAAQGGLLQMLAPDRSGGVGRLRIQNLAVDSVHDIEPIKYVRFGILA